MQGWQASGTCAISRESTQGCGEHSRGGGGGAALSGHLVGADLLYEVTRVDLRVGAHACSSSTCLLLGSPATHGLRGVSLERGRWRDGIVNEKRCTTWARCRPSNGLMEGCTTQRCHDSIHNHACTRAHLHRALLLAHAVGRAGVQSVVLIRLLHLLVPAGAGSTGTAGRPPQRSHYLERRQGDHARLPAPKLTGRLLREHGHTSTPARTRTRTHIPHARTMRTSVLARRLRYAARTHRSFSTGVGLGSVLRRCISRNTVMRWRGVRVTSREGQLLSQNPHSMHLQQGARRGSSSRAQHRQPGLEACMGRRAPRTMGQHARPGKGACAG